MDATRRGLTDRASRGTSQSMKTIPLNLDGMTDLPQGKVANVATCLQMFEAPAGHTPLATPDGCRLDLLGAGQAERYRTLYARVGEPWLWFSRLSWSLDEIASRLRDKDIEALALTGPGGDSGILELDFRADGDVELSFFGLAPASIGSGLGRYLMSEAITRAFARGQRRFWVHTCTLDHPSALGFYIRSGFTPYKRLIEVADDPRLTGLSSPDAAPHVPVIEPD